MYPTSASHSSAGRLSHSGRVTEPNHSLSEPQIKGFTICGRMKVPLQDDLDSQGKFIPILYAAPAFTLPLAVLYWLTCLSTENKNLLRQ